MSEEKRNYITELAFKTIEDTTTPTNVLLVSETMRLARNVRYFGVKRISKRTFEISLQIQAEQSEDEILENIEPVIISSETMVLVAPGVE